MKKIIAFIIFVLIFTISAAFAAFNLSPVTVDYYFDQATVPLSILFIIAMVAGIVIGTTIMFIQSLKLRYEIRRLKNKLDVSEQEINSLRILPIKDAP